MHYTRFKPVLTEVLGNKITVVTFEIMTFLYKKRIMRLNELGQDFVIRLVMRL